MTTINDTKMIKASTAYLKHIDELRKTEDAIELARKDFSSEVLDIVYEEVREDIIDGIYAISQIGGIPQRVLYERYINGKTESQIADELYYCERSIRSFVRSGKLRIFDLIPERYRVLASA